MLGMMSDALGEIVGGPPRRILLLVGWRVGDTAQDWAECALVISSLLALLTAAIWACSASLCCDTAVHQRRRRRRLEAEGTQSVAEAARVQPLWTVHNRRYDLRKFVAAHPGGAGAICLGQGRNCTALFESYHSLANEALVRATLARYYVEDCPAGATDYCARFVWSQGGGSPFYDSLKARVRAHFKDGRFVNGHRAPPAQWVQLLLMVALSGVALLGFMRGSAACMLALPFAYWWGPSPCMHDGGHFSLSRRPWLNQLLGHLGGAHMSMLSWQHQHTVGHHVHTNVAGADPDLYHFSVGIDGGLPGFRTSLELKTVPESPVPGAAVTRSDWLRWGQWLRVPLTTLGPTLIWDTMSLAQPALEQSFLGLVPYRPLLKATLIRHAIGRAVVVWLAFIHPITIALVCAHSWVGGALAAATYALLPYLVHGCLFYAFSQVSHVQRTCFDVTGAAPSRSAENISMQGPASATAVASSSPPSPPKEWAVHQVEHALDYAVGSRFWLHCSNGLNLQVVHHLFPQVGWGHYLALAPIIQRTAAEHGVVYATLPSFGAALDAHLAWLREINVGPALADVWVAPPSRGSASADVLGVLGQGDAQR
jgi:fatty acid desaturase